MYSLKCGWYSPTTTTKTSEFALRVNVSKTQRTACLDVMGWSMLINTVPRFMYRSGTLVLVTGRSGPSVCFAENNYSFMTLR